MKKILIFSIICLLGVPFAFQHNLLLPAATVTPTPTSAQPLNNLEQQITDLKDKIASRVAQLNLVEKRGIIGTVTDVNPTQITLNDIHGNTRFIDIDELTQFSSPSASANFGISDITKGSVLGVLGLYNKQSQRILGRFVDVMVIPTLISGGVSAIDKTNYTVTIATADKKSYSVDVEDITKTSSYDPTAGLTRSGFSKITLGERITVIGFPDMSNALHIIASRMLIFPTLPVDPAIIITKPQDLQLQGTVVPSTGSGVKLTPLNK